MSTQSLGLTCITCAVAINPSFIESLEFITTFLEARDPKLRSSVAKVNINIDTFFAKLFCLD